MEVKDIIQYYKLPDGTETSEIEKSRASFIEEGTAREFFEGESIKVVTCEGTVYIGVMTKIQAKLIEITDDEYVVHKIKFENIEQVDKFSE